MEKDKEKPVKLDGIALQYAQQFKYLGSVLSLDGNVEMDVKSLMKSTWCVNGGS